MRSSEQKEVYKANAAFYSAFEKLDISKMEKLWLNEDYVQCIHPGWGLVKGWEPVMTSWLRIFENTDEMHFMITEVRIEVRDALAWVTLYENITSRTGEEITSGVVMTTNIFEKRPKGWMLIHHHGSTVVNPPAFLWSSTFH